MASKLVRILYSAALSNKWDLSKCLVEMKGSYTDPSICLIYDVNNDYVKNSYFSNDSIYVRIKTIREALEELSNGR